MPSANRRRRCSSPPTPSALPRRRCALAASHRSPPARFPACRYEATEFLYGDEIRAYHDDGILNHLKTAFSRDQEEKIYAQHRIAEDPELLYDYMVNKDAHFYLCGPAGNMPKQMKDAVVDALAKVGGMPREQADATVTDWQIKGKYNVEVW